MAFKILIVDDHLVVRIGVGMVLKDQIEDVNISNAESFCETITLLKQETFDLLILEINISGGKSREILAEIKVIQPNIKILIFSTYDQRSAYKYILLGAHGYLNKLSCEKIIVTAVKTILEGGSYISAEIVEKIIQAALHKIEMNPLDVLSKREFEIAELLVIGNGNLEIANKLNIQMSTVSTYKNRMYEKLKIRTLVELIDVFKMNIY
ncbi:LuxR C-terminal-related transcriptional regulator [Flavobacterium geliluteum]|uniref:Response regulator transcription factor n=1 Tax=Flavobacterium geliluteum TaxID=2816120 RepID=A0A941AWP3_9FLAO|nr:response regulator transcription factor [Flavobacterium geliluteum]MBP4136916.1 response regulator transcription factor [Flavobacterium geliluteum]